MSLPPPLPSSPQRDHRDPIVIKAHCSLCSFYDDCPRMKGDAVCYGKKELLYPPSEFYAHSSDQSLDED